MILFTGRGVSVPACTIGHMTGGSPFRGVSVQGGLCPGGLSLEGGLCPGEGISAQGVSVQGVFVRETPAQ